MKYKIVIIVLGLILLGTLGAYLYFGYILPSRQKKQVQQQQAAQQTSQNAIDASKSSPVNNFGLQGKVVSITPTELGLSAQILKDGKAVPLEKSFSLDKDTNYRISSQGKLSKASISDVKIGQNVSVSTFQYPYDQNEVYAYYVTILK